jgi:hypothetical protein
LDPQFQEPAATPAAPSPHPPPGSPDSRNRRPMNKDRAARPSCRPACHNTPSESAPGSPCRARSRSHRSAAGLR